MLEMFKKNKSIISVDFSQTTTSAALVQRLQSGINVLDYGMSSFSQQDQRYNDRAVAFINEFMRKNSVTLKSKDVIINIEDMDSVFIKYISLPDLPSAEIINAAKWQLKDEVPFVLERSSIDWQLVDNYIDEEGVRKNGYIFSVIKEEAVEGALDIISRCNLNPVRISCGPFNYADVLRNVSDSSSISAVMDMNFEDSTLCIYINNKLNFVRRIPVSWAGFVQSLTEVLVSDKGKIEITEDEAQEILCGSGIPRDDDECIKDNIYAHHVVSLIRPRLEAQCRELKFSFDYFRKIHNKQMPDRLYLTGYASYFRNLGAYLNKELNIPVHVLPYPDCISFVQKTQDSHSFEDSQKLISVLGSTLEHAGNINLLPQEIKEQKTQNIQKVSLRLLGITGFAVFLFLMFIAELQVRDYRKRLDNALIHLKTIEKIDEMERDVRIKEGLVLSILKDRVPIDGLLKVIANLVPVEMKLTEITFDQGSHSVTINGSILTGKDRREGILTDFMERIEASSFFTEANFVSSSDVGKDQVFQITCDLVRE